MMEMSMMALLTIVPVHHSTNDVAAIDNFDVSMVQSTVYNLGASNYRPPKLTAPSTAPPTIGPTRESNIGTSNDEASINGASNDGASNVGASINGTSNDNASN